MYQKKIDKSFKSFFKIEFLDDSYAKPFIFKDSNIINIGRSNQNDIVLNQKDKNISRNHCTIYIKDNKIFLEDKSSNGTYINDEKQLGKTSELIGEEIIKFSKNGERIKIKIKKNQNDNSIVSENSSISMTKLIPFNSTGFSSKLISQSFFWPLIFILMTGVLLFAFISNEVVSILSYQYTLGLTLSITSIFGLKSILQSKTPIWLSILSMISLIVIFYLTPIFFILSLIFRPPIIDYYLNQSTDIGNIFIGHFIGAGLMEELFKSIPLLVIIFLRKKFENLNYIELTNNVKPNLSILIAASSAIGFILFETLGQYVPDIQSDGNYTSGFMLLIPRFTTAFALHIGCSGIFGYFISLCFYSKIKIQYFLIGWILSSFLHALWNTSTYLNNFIILSIVGLINLIIFLSYVYKSRSFFEEKKNEN